ncbi:E3 UFM1-protein ligase 1 [Aplysia californica]|uniref:E3 UFM1-protein ligase 1 n=1 Tax=Aplysia californica TaxID=6500 RepID=A0ABM0JGJ4_APLCA|nr:E3 UFM1-protein ligase 1 [Aplysia californica]
MFTYCLTAKRVGSLRLNVDNMEEVWKLAAEFQALQLSTAKQKLSERNVIELVSKLVDFRLIDVLYTADGKTYLTHQQLGKEIKDELIIRGGRINLVELQQLLNVDYSHIEAKVNDMVKHDHHLVLVLGQLIDSSYRTRLSEEINDLLQEKGHVTIIELTKTHDLPAEFLREVIEENLGKKIKGQIDSYDRDVVFTEVFVRRKRAEIRGALSAVTVPTTLGPVRQAVGCQEHLFHTILEELLSSGRLAGGVMGSRQDKSQFLPDIYTRAQHEWVDSFYRQNGYLDYDAIARLGISDPKSYVKKRFKSETMVFLSSCCVGPAISEQVQYSLDEALGLGTYVDVASVLPSVLSRKDVSELVTSCLKSRSGAIVCDMTIVASESLVADSALLFSDIMAQKAEKTVLSHPTLISGEATGGAGDKSNSHKVAGIDDGSSAREDKKEQRRKKAASAGTTKKEGTGGREVKMKSTKKKGRGRDIDDGSDEDMAAPAQGSKGKQQELQFLSVAEITKVLREQERLKDCPEELLTEVASRLHRPLQKQYQEVAKSIFLKTSGAEKKKTAGEIQDKVNGLWTNARLFEKGLKLFEEPAQGQLTKHLLKTVGSDLANTVVVALASDSLLNVANNEEEQLTPEARLRLIGQLPKELQEALSRLHGLLSGQSLEDFFSQLETLCGPAHLGILLKKPDKRKERQLVFHHRQSLSEQLREETDPAMTLHLCVVVLFQTVTQCMLHAPGRLVPTILQFLTTHLEADKLEVLTQMQDLVVRHAKLKADPDGENLPEFKDVANSMTVLLGKVKDIALNTKKTTSTADD